MHLQEEVAELFGKETEQITIKKYWKFLDQNIRKFQKSYKLQSKYTTTDKKLQLTQKKNKQPLKRLHILFPPILISHDVSTRPTYYNINVLHISIQFLNVNMVYWEFNALNLVIFFQ